MAKKKRNKSSNDRLADWKSSEFKKIGFGPMELFTGHGTLDYRFASIGSVKECSSWQGLKKLLVPSK
jgi:hypothetical protein